MIVPAESRGDPEYHEHPIERMYLVSTISADAWMIISKEFIMQLILLAINNNVKIYWLP